MGDEIAGGLGAFALIAAVATPIAIIWGVIALARYTSGRFDYRMFWNPVNWLIVAAWVTGWLGLYALSGNVGQMAGVSHAPATQQNMNAAPSSEPVTAEQAPQVVPHDPPTPAAEKPDEEPNGGIAAVESAVEHLSAEQVYVPLAEVLWSDRPSPREVSRSYPRRSRRGAVEGRVTLDCVVEPGLTLTCNVESEEPQGQGFADAALRLARYYRVEPQSSTGVSMPGQRLRLPFDFQPEPER